MPAPNPQARVTPRSKARGEGRATWLLEPTKGHVSFWEDHKSDFEFLKFLPFFGSLRISTIAKEGEWKLLQETTGARSLQSQDGSEKGCCRRRAGGGKGRKIKNKTLRKERQKNGTSIFLSRSRL